MLCIWEDRTKEGETGWEEDLRSRGMSKAESVMSVARVGEPVRSLCMWGLLTNTHHSPLC